MIMEAAILYVFGIPLESVKSRVWTSVVYG